MKEITPVLEKIARMGAGRVAALSSASEAIYGQVEELRKADLTEENIAHYLIGAAIGFAKVGGGMTDEQILSAVKDVLERAATQVREEGS